MIIPAFPQLTFICNLSLPNQPGLIYLEFILFELRDLASSTPVLLTEEIEDCKQCGVNPGNERCDCLTLQPALLLWGLESGWS